MILNHSTQYFLGLNDLGHGKSGNRSSPSSQNNWLHMTLVLKSGEISIKLNSDSSTK